MKRARKQTGKPWGPEIARVVEIERIKTEAALKALQDVIKTARRNKTQLDSKWHISEGRDVQDVIRGQWLCWDKVLEYAVNKSDAIRRKAK